MLVFLDTEFTDLLQPQLLSLGLAALDGRELYAELDLATDIGKARAKAATEFVRDGGVLDQWRMLPGSTCTDWEIGRRAGEWLIGLAVESSSNVEVAFDYSTDYMLLEDAVRNGGLWHQIRQVVRPVVVSAMTEKLPGKLASANFQSVGSKGILLAPCGVKIADTLMSCAREHWRDTKVPYLVDGSTSAQRLNFGIDQDQSHHDCW